MKQVIITYCKPCGYEARAVRAAEALKADLGIDAELVPGRGGIFTIAVGDTVVGQKTRYGFPSETDVVAAVAKAVRASTTRKR